MEYRYIGKSGLRVSPICLGTMGFGSWSDKAESFRLLDAAFDRGINFFDTAEVYPVPPTPELVGDTETIFGEWIKTRNRDSLIIATKVAGAASGWFVPPIRQGLTAIDRHHVEAAVEGSLHRLGIDYIDLYQVHWPDTVVPIDESMEALDRLVASGKVRYLGTSNESAYGLTKANTTAEYLGLAKFQSIQNNFSLINPRFLDELANVCRANDIIVLSDEIYSQINFTEDFSPSIFKFYPERTIVFGGLSKVFSAGGYRLGFMALPKDLQFSHDTFRSMFSETFSAVASPIQFAALEAFKMKNDVRKYITDSSAILNGLSHYIVSNLKKVGVHCTQPQGAFYMMIGFNNFKDKINALGIKTSSHLANHLLENFNVALLPASDFYFTEEELFFRLAYVDFDGEAALKAYNSNSMIDEEFIKMHCPNIFGGSLKILEFVKKLAY